ncbi:hypothetical protein KAR10_08610, partial [bacterium]|nr:hypothetical protein [bacterium]
DPEVRRPACGRNNGFCLSESGADRIPVIFYVVAGFFALLSKCEALPTKERSLVLKANRDALGCIF